MSKKAKSAATGVLVVAGLLLLASEAQTIPDQIKAVACGFVFWGAAWAVWQLWGRAGYLIRKAAHCLREALEEEIEEVRNKAA